MSEAIDSEQQISDEALIKRPLAALNYKIESVEAGIIRLMVDKIDGQKIYETIVKTDDEIEYIICDNEVKTLEEQDDGQSIEVTLEAGSDEEKYALEAIESAIQIVQQSTMQQCCANIKDLALRPSIRPDFIDIQEPQTIEECYEFLISIGDGDNYVMIDDECPYILRSLALEGDEEQLVILKPSEFEEVIAKINQKISPIFEQDIANVETISLKKDAELRQEIIDNLRQEVQLLMVGVTVFDDDGDSVFMITTNLHTYAIYPNQIVIVDPEKEVVILSSKLDRFMMHDALEAITESCAIISEQSEAVKECYDKIAVLAEAEEGKPDFITKQDVEEEGDQPYFTVEINNVFYVISMDERDCYMIFRQDEDAEEPVFLAPQEIAPFISAVNKLIAVEEAGV